MTTYPAPSSSQVSVTPPGGGQVIWLGSVGHVMGLTYSYAYPGGDDQMSCTLEVPAAYRSQTLALNSKTRIFRGAHQLWEGLLEKPAPLPGGGWSLTAVGNGNKAADYLALYSGTWPSGQPDDLVNQAIARGLPWVNPGIGTPAGMWLGQAQDSGSQSVADILNLVCTRGGLGWSVSCQPGGPIGSDLTIAPLPTTVTRLLVCTSPVARASGGDVKAIYIRYCSAADNATTGAAATYAVTSVTNTGHVTGKEAYLDISNAGVLTAGAAQAVGNQILKVYQQASFSSPFPVQHGSILTTGGVPVDPGCERAGEVYQLILTDFSYGGDPNLMTPVTFIGGAYQWNDQDQVGSLTAYQTLDQSLSGLLSAQQTVLTPITTGS